MPPFYTVAMSSYNTGKKFGKKRYYYSGSHSGKGDAKFHAKELREKGCPSRVRWGVDWEVWSRDKRGGRCKARTGRE